MKLVIDNVSKIFDEATPKEHAALIDVSASVDADMILLAGASGSGKTTLLSLIGGMVRPSRGRIFVDDVEVTGLPERFRTVMRRNTFGFVFQRFNLIRGLSARQNVMLPAYPEGIDPATLTERTERLFDSLGILNRIDARVEQLSGGQMQRVAIARALVNTPAAILLDEPTAHLDRAAATGVLDILMHLKDAGTAIVVASHDPVIMGLAAVTGRIDLADGRTA